MIDKQMPALPGIHGATCRRTDGQPCNRYPLAGSTVCRTHLANPAARASAAVRAEIAKWAWGLTDQPTIDPGAYLLALVAQSAGRAARYAELLQSTYEKNPASALIGPTYGLTADGTIVEVGEDIRKLVLLEAAERDRGARFSKLALDAGIAERQVRLAEQQGQLIATVMRGILHDLGLTPEQEQAAPEIVARHVRAVS